MSSPSMVPASTLFMLVESYDNRASKVHDCRYLLPDPECPDRNTNEDIGRGLPQEAFDGEFYSYVALGNEIEHLPVLINVFHRFASLCAAAIQFDTG